MLELAIRTHSIKLFGAFRRMWVSMIGKIVGYLIFSASLGFRMLLNSRWVTLVFYSVENFGLCGFERFTIPSEEIRGFGLAN